MTALAPTTRLPALQLGSLEVTTPVVLAPMAGITNAAYRRLCREQGSWAPAEQTGPSSGSADTAGGLYVCEMITSRGLVEGDPTTRKMLVFDELESVRSVQLYGTDPAYVGKATEILCAEYGVGHVDLNFGCPVPKVTRKGGGAALPWKRTLLGEILEAAVAAGARYDVPVTMKTRKGIDDDHLTYLDAGRIAQQAGVAAIALHGRTAMQGYSGTADWDAIARLVEHVEIPVLGNGDIWEAADAVRMVEQTGADGVVVGRGCLGRPWLFRELAAAFSGAPAGEPGASHPAATRGGGRHDASPCRASQPAHGGGAGLQGVPQARVVVPQGLPRRRRAAPRPGPGEHPRRARPSCSGGSTRMPRFRSPSWAPLAAGRAAHARRSRCRTGGSRTPTGPGASYARTRRRPRAGSARTPSTFRRYGDVSALTWRASRTGTAREHWAFRGSSCFHQRCFSDPRR